eukprot:NODE_78_length_23131_cov_0.599427.p13 type:complete len:149 gc:universal NODE_78_length_23131_cov_0.599427:20353-19907(-)
MALILSLNSAAVSRCKSSWEQIKPAKKQKLEEIEQIMNMDGNYKAYREIYQTKLKNDELFLPFLGLFLKDLVFLNDGNPKKMHELINFSKLTMFRLKLEELEKFQARKVTYAIDNEMVLFKHYISTTKILNSDQIYNLSRKSFNSNLF